MPRLPDSVDTLIAVALGDPAADLLAPYIAQAYGTPEAYEAAKREAGIAPDHAANFERYGVVLQPKQLELVVWARECDRDDGPTEIGFGGARGPGKSFAWMAQVALDDCQRFPGLKVLYLRKTGKAAGEQLEDLTDSVLRHCPDATVTASKIAFSNGSRVIIGGFKDDREAAKYQGIEYDALLIEEATQLSEKTYKTLRLSARSTKTHDGQRWRARTYTSTNPLGIGHQWYKKRYVDNERRGRPNPRCKFIFGTVEDNVFIPPEYIDILDDLSGAEFRAYRAGDWDVSAGAYFDEWNETRHVIPALPSIPHTWQLYASMDYGYNHWNVIYLHGKSEDGQIVTIDELCHRKHYPHEIAPDYKALLARYGRTPSDVRAFWVGADVFRRTGQSDKTIAEQYRALGMDMMQADVSPGSRVLGAHTLARLLGNVERGVAPRWQITDRCQRLRDTLPYLERDPHNSEDVLKVDSGDNGEGGDDAYDGARYGVVSIATQRALRVTTGRYA